MQHPLLGIHSSIGRHPGPLPHLASDLVSDLGLRLDAPGARVVLVLGPRLLDVPLLLGPALVGQHGIVLQLDLAGDVGLLLLQARGVEAGMAQPLVPEGRDAGLHVAVVDVVGALDDAAHARGVVGAAELPVGVADEVLAGEELAPPGQAEHLPFQPELADRVHLVLDGVDFGWSVGRRAERCVGELTMGY